MDQRPLQHDKMKVYVVMGNDYPEAVFSRYDDAAAFIVKKQKEPRTSPYPGPGIYWRSYSFTMDEHK